MIDSVLRDDPTKSNMHNREGLSPKMIWQALTDWRMWPLYVLGLVHFSALPFAAFDPHSHGC